MMELVRMLLVAAVAGAVAGTVWGIVSGNLHRRYICRGEAVVEPVDSAMTPRGGEMWIKGMNECRRVAEHTFLPYVVQSDRGDPDYLYARNCDSDLIRNFDTKGARFTAEVTSNCPSESRDSVMAILDQFQQGVRAFRAPAPAPSPPEKKKELTAGEEWAMRFQTRWEENPGVIARKAALRAERERGAELLFVRIVSQPAALQSVEDVSPLPQAVARGGLLAGIAVSAAFLLLLIRRGVKRSSIRGVARSAGELKPGDGMRDPF